VHQAVPIVCELTVCQYQIILPQVLIFIEGDELASSSFVFQWTILRSPVLERSIFSLDFKV